jgi:DNA polymerase III epsilon subunit family exonuclease
MGLAEAVRRLDSGELFVALDFETTGLYAERDRICEYGALKFSKEGELEEFSLLCDPGMPISREASAVSGITDEMVRGLEGADHALPSFVDFLGGAGLMAHNAPFDMSFLYAAVARVSGKKPPNPVFDSRTMAKEAFPGFPRYSLQDLARTFSIDPGSAHRALDDAYTCMRLFMKCVERFRERAKT